MDGAVSYWMGDLVWEGLCQPFESSEIDTCYAGLFSVYVLLFPPPFAPVKGNQTEQGCCEPRRSRGLATGIALIRFNSFVAACTSLEQRHARQDSGHVSGQVRIYGQQLHV